MIGEGEDFRSFAELSGPDRETTFFVPFPIRQGALHRTEELSDDVSDPLSRSTSTGGIHRARRSSAANHEIILFISAFGHFRSLLSDFFLRGSASDGCCAMPKLVVLIPYP